jgi:hypothetical protein
MTAEPTKTGCAECGEVAHRGGDGFCECECHDDKEKQTLYYKYAVVGTWGKVPKQIAEIVGSNHDVLLYPDYRGEHSDQSVFDHKRREVTGGWTMEYRGVHAAV